MFLNVNCFSPFIFVYISKSFCFVKTEKNSLARLFDNFSELDFACYYNCSAYSLKKAFITKIFSMMPDALARYFEFMAFILFLNLFLFFILLFRFFYLCYKKKSACVGGLLITYFFFNCSNMEIC